ncbi:flagellar protein FlgN (plasmid) [Phyllobacterium sp. 628]|nr:flagellar protein FlgN [Phyllobacterium sp. 628]
MFAIKRLEEVVERETRLLLDGETIDLADINSHKSRGLRDFNKAMNKAAKTAGTPALKSLQPVLDSLRQKLDRNCEAIKLHLRAVTELTGIIRDALETQEADGTYTALQMRNGQGA